MVAVWALGATAGAQDRCALSGSVRVFADVQPRGTAPFAVEVEGPTLTARPRANGMWDIEVAEPLAFAARATDVPVRLAREIRSAERIVTLGPDARIERVRPARGGRVRFSAWA